MPKSERVNFCSVCGSRLEPREAFGRMRPACPSCGRIHFQDPKVAAAALVEKDGRILLTRRVNVPQQGKWTLPAGFVEADEDPMHAAERECLEETGMQIRVTDLLDVIYGLEHPRGANILILYRGEIVDGELAAKDDADEVGFFGPDELPPLAFESTRRALDHWHINH